MAQIYNRLYKTLLYLLKPRPHQQVQQCRSNRQLVEATFDFVEAFDFIATNGNIVAKNGNDVEATFDIVERIVELVAFDNVVSTLLLVWTGLY